MVNNFAKKCWPNMYYYSRDGLQERVYTWIVKTFGKKVAKPQERALRLVEEAVEAAQAVDVDVEIILATIRFVYEKPKGNIAQEIGGIGVTLLALAASLNISAHDEEGREAERVMKMDPEHFRKRHNIKAKAGIAEYAPAKRKKK